MPLILDPDMGSWKIGGFEMCTAAFAPANLTELAKLWSSRPISIQNQPLPGLPGELPRRPGMPGATHAIEMEIAGDVDTNGDPRADVGVGIDTNYLALQLIVGDPTTWGGEMVFTVVERPYGGVYEGEIQPSLSPILSVSGGIARCVLTVTIPFGKLTPVSGSSS